MPTPIIIGNDEPTYIGQNTSLDGGGARGANIAIPPFRWTDGKIYVAFVNVTTSGELDQFLAIASTVDPSTTPFATQDIAHSPNIGATAPSWAFDETNGKIYCLSQDHSTYPSLTAPIEINVFDLNTGLWGTEAVTGPSATARLAFNDYKDVCLVQISAHKFFCFYYDASNPANLKYVIADAGVWGTPAILVPGIHPGYPNDDSGGYVLAAGPDPDGTTHALVYQFIGSGASASGALNYYRIDSSGIVLGSTTVNTSTTSFNPIPRIAQFAYLSGIDTVVFAFFGYPGGSWITPIGDVFLIEATPTSAPVVTMELVLADVSSLPTGPLVGAPYFFTSLDQSTYYVGMELILDDGLGPLGNGTEQLVLFQRAASGTPGVWSGPTVFYDATVDPPSGANLPPVYVNSPDSPLPPAELNSQTYGFLADGTMIATVGMLSNWCGVIFYLAQAPASVQTLELTKVVSGGPSATGDFFLEAVGPDTISGMGHVGPAEVTAGTFELSETIPTVPGGTYVGVWNCGDAEMPTGTSVVVPSGGTVACVITNTFTETPPPPPPPAAGNDAVGCFELIRVDVTLMPARHLPTRGSVK